MATERLVSDAKAHYENCTTLAKHCRAVKQRYDRDKQTILTRLEAADISEHVDKVMTTLRQAREELNKEDVKKRYRPEFLQTIDYVLNALPMTEHKALDFGRGGFNRFEERFADQLFGIVYLIDLVADPYNAGFPKLLPPLTMEGPAIKVPDDW